MPNGWSALDVSAGSGSLSASGIVTNQPITREFTLTAGGATEALVLKIKTSAATVVGAITAKLQTAIGADWVDSKTVSITGTPGDFYIKLNDDAAADQTFFPLLNKGRVVVSTTNAGDSFTVTEVNLLQNL